MDRELELESELDRDLEVEVDRDLELDREVEVDRELELERGMDLPKRRFTTPAGVGQGSPGWGSSRWTKWRSFALPTRLPR